MVEAEQWQDQNPKCEKLQKEPENYLQRICPHYLSDRKRIENKGEKGRKKKKKEPNNIYAEKCSDATYNHLHIIRAFSSGFNSSQSIKTVCSNELWKQLYKQGFIIHFIYSTKNVKDEWTKDPQCSACLGPGLLIWAPLRYKK